MKRSSSKLIAMVVMCALVLSLAQPVFARTWGEFFTDTGTGALIGVIGGGALAFFTGGAAIPLLIGGAAAGSAYGMADENTKGTLGFLSGMAALFLGVRTNN